MDATAFISALNELAESKGISKEAVVDALKEALQRAYVKYLGGGDDAVVTANIDPEKGTIEVAQIKKVVKDVQDDYLEISLEDANKGLKKAAYKVGDDYAIPCPAEDLTKLTAMAVKNNLRQKIAEAERSALYDIYKDRIGEMITGTVEKADDRSVSVNIGRTVVELGRHEMIGDEYFKVGDPIKVYIQEVKTAAPDPAAKGPRGPQIEVTRSSEGFLKRLFEEEIREVYDGTVVIKSIAREAGIRSKVAVYSNNEDVDATGACIGPGGSRIQKIVGQLGNGKDKEKIDVINYSENTGLFIVEALRPATVIGVSLTDPAALPYPKAIAIVKDEQLSLAIGRKGANARLANKITGWSIDIQEESKAKAAGIVYKTTEELLKEADDQKKVLEKENYLKKSQEGAIKRQAKVEEIQPTVAPKAQVNPDELPPEAANPAAAALQAIREQEQQEAAAPQPSEEPIAAPAPAAEEAAPADVEAPSPIQEAVAPQPAAPIATSVTTTTTLSDLEKELEASKERKSQPVSKTRRPRKITEEEVKHATPASPTSPTKPGLAIYSQEELDAMAKEEAENPTEADAKEEENDEDIDYADFDKYYDDGSK